jgi:hypothetical protein
MVEIYQSQSLWDNRQHPRVHGAFAQIWGTEKLWCSMDRANMKPPVREDQPEWQHPGMIHWDADTTSGETTFRVQGVLYLADTDENGGGFRECCTECHTKYLRRQSHAEYVACSECIPGFHRKFENWHRGLGSQVNKDRQSLMQHLPKGEATPIPGKAGDLLIVRLHQTIRIIANGQCDSIRRLLSLFCVHLGCV